MVIEMKSRAVKPFHLKYTTVCFTNCFAHKAAALFALTNKETLTSNADLTQ